MMERNICMGEGEREGRGGRGRAEGEGRERRGGREGGGEREWEGRGGMTNHRDGWMPGGVYTYIRTCVWRAGDKLSGARPELHDSRGCVRSHLGT